MNKRHLEVIKRESKAMIIISRRRSSSSILLSWVGKPWDEIMNKNLTAIKKLRRWIAKEQLNFRAAQSKEEERPISLHNNLHLAKAAKLHRRFLNTNKMKLKSISYEPNK